MFLFFIGFLSLLTQSILIRETYLSIANNEISTCIFLSSWLLFNGLGVFISSRKGNFVIYLTIFTIILPFYILISYNIHFLFNKSPGEILRISEVLIIYYVIFSPLFLIIGSLFGRGLREWRKEDDLKGYIRPYIYEALGNLTGGFVFSYVLLRFFNFNYRFYLIYGLIILLYLFRGKKKIYFLQIVIISAILTQFIVVKSIEREYAGYRFLRLIDSRYNRYIIRERDGVKSVFIDGNLSFSFPQEYYDELQLIPFTLRSNKENEILSIGFPTPSESERLIKFGRLNIVVYDKNLIDYYPQNINWIFKDPLTLSDKKKYDFIFINSGLPYNISNNRFYTLEFLQSIKEYLKKDGIIVLKIPSSDIYLDDCLKEINGTVLKTGLRLFEHYLFFPMETGIFLFSDTPFFISKEEIKKRLDDYEFKYLNLSYLEFLIERAKIFSDIISGDFKISTIKNPILFYLFVKYFALKYNEGFFKILKFVEKIPFYIFIAFFSIPLIRKNILYNVFLIGFLGISTEIIILFLFQSINGSLYQYVSAIIGSFMLGIATGGFFFEKKTKDYYLNVVFLILSFIYVFIILIPLKGFNIIISFIINFLTGFSVGLAYSCSTFISGREKRKEAAKIYFLDLAGASFGSFFVSLFLLPIYGIQKVSIIFLVISVSGFILRIIR